MKITDEISLIGPGFKRLQDDNIHMGFWTPQLAVWTDEGGFEEKRDLQEFTYISGVRDTGAMVNACPIVCIVESEIAERDLTVSITANIGVPSGYVISGDQIITGFSVDHQYGTDIYRREWVTGGLNPITYEFTIPAHTLPGKTYLMPNKRIYKITDVNVLPQRQDQPLTNLGFYALADNGSKLLYSFNWNKVYDDLKTMLYSFFASPKKCPTCNGSGYVLDESDECQQCGGYKYSGWNATGFMFDQIAREVGVVADSGESFASYQDKVWAKKWKVTPTKQSIQEYIAHFARVEPEEITIINNFRTTSTSGVESIVDVMVPYIIPQARFSTNSTFWKTMVEEVEPAGVNIRFSFLIGQGTGAWEFEADQSAYMPYYSGDAVYYTGGTGSDNLVDPHGYGFHEAFSLLGVIKHSGWYQRWITPWMNYNFISGAVDGITGTDGVSGYAVLSGASWSWSSGLLTGTTWMKWAQPAETLANDTIWATGESPFVVQDLLTGTYLWDNFWSSGEDGNIYY